MTGLALLSLITGFVYVLMRFGSILAFPSHQSTPPAQILRSLRGEPLAVQDVNDTADVLQKWDNGREIELFADETMRRHASSAEMLPLAEFDAGRAIPLEELPKKFWTIGGTWRSPPQVVLRLDANFVPGAVLLKWGHGRHHIVVYATPPSRPPNGDYTRKVSARTYVVAY